MVVAVVETVCCIQQTDVLCTHRADVLCLIRVAVIKHTLRLREKNNYNNYTSASLSEVNLYRHVAIAVKYDSETSTMYSQYA